LIISTRAAETMAGRTQIAWTVNTLRDTGIKHTNSRLW